MCGGKIFHIFVDLSINEYFEISWVVLWLFTKTPINTMMVMYRKVSERDLNKEAVF